MTQVVAGGFEAEATGVAAAAAPAVEALAPWQQAHVELQRLAVERAELDFEEGCWLLRAFRASAHVELGYGSFREYAEWLFGYRPKVTQDKLRVAEALEGLPEMAQALETGRVCFSAVKELCRVATAETEQEWLEASRGRPVRDIEKMVSGHRPGSRPGDAPDPGAKRHVLRFEVSGEVFATFREAHAKIRRDSGEPLDDDAVLLLLARHVLEGPKDEGRSSYQIAFTVCESCGQGRQHGKGELVRVAPEIIEMACCDAQHVGHVGGEAHVGAEQGCDCAAHVGAATKATQSVPPALRRAASFRDHGRCRVPGCRNAVFLDLHHIWLRSDGGGHTLDNLVTVCSAHHRAIHDEKLFIEKTPTRLRFFHADGTEYGGRPLPVLTPAMTKARAATEAPTTSEARAKAESALKHMGVGSPGTELEFAL